MDGRLAADLGAALRLAGTAAKVGSPVSHDRLLRMVVETAVQVIGARGGSLLLLDEPRDELVFEVAVGSEAEELTGLRVPLGHGVAGLVAATAQPMAVSDAESDPRVATDVAERIGYVPRSLLCVPLFYADRVIGVLELVDKEGPTSFSGADARALALFANHAAVAIRQSRAHQTIAALLADLLEAAGEGAAPAELQERARSIAEELESDEPYAESLRLAELVHEIAGYGEHEARACYELLRGFADYLRARPRAADELGRVGA
jgi:GAF domain-containing protein